MKSKLYLNTKTSVTIILQRPASMSVLEFILAIATAMAIPAVKRAATVRHASTCEVPRYGP